MNNKITINIETAKEISSFLEFLRNDLKEDLLETNYCPADVLHGVQIIWELTNILNCLTLQIKEID